MKKFKLISKLRVIFSLILSALVVFYAFNFSPRNANIIASRSAGQQVFDYTLNFVFFFVVIYIISSVIIYLYQKFSPHAK